VARNDARGNISLLRDKIRGRPRDLSGLSRHRTQQAQVSATHAAYRKKETGMTRGESQPQELGAELIRMALSVSGAISHLAYHAGI